MVRARLLGLLFLVSTLGGCLEDSVTTIASPTPGAEVEGYDHETRPIIRLFGTIIREDTLQGVVGATVSTCGLGDAVTDLDGRFQIDIEERMRGTIMLRIEADGLATRSVARYVDNTADTNETIIFALVDDDHIGWGTISMSSSVAADVAVTVQGNLPPPSVTVVPIPANEFLTAVGPLPIVCPRFTQIFLTANGVAPLSLLDPDTEYWLIVNAVDPDTGVRTTKLVPYLFSRDGDRIGIDLDFAKPDRQPTMVASNLVDFAFLVPTGPIAHRRNGFGQNEVGDRALPGADEDEFVDVAQAIVSDDGSVTVVFETPVRLVGAGEPRFEFRNNLVNPDDPDYDDRFNRTFVPATITDLLASAAPGLVFTFTPATPLPENEVFDLKFFAAPEGQVNGKNFSLTCYRPAMTPIGAASVDNYDGRDTETELPPDLAIEFPDFPSPAYLEFPEVVKGTYKVLQVMRGSDGVLFLPAPALEMTIGDDDSSAGPDSIVQNWDDAPAARFGAELGVGTGIFFRTPLRTNTTMLASDGSSTLAFEEDQLVLFNGDEVTVIVSVCDAEGNIFDTTVTLTVSGRSTLGDCTDTGSCQYAPAVAYVPGPTATEILAYTDTVGLTREFEIEYRWPQGAPEPLPIVVWSHGGSAGRIEASTVGNEWGDVFVRAGYLVVAIAHRPRDPTTGMPPLCAALNIVDPAECQAKALTWDRPFDVMEVLDRLEEREQADLAGRIDVSRIVYAGHSAGAGGVMMIAGATRDFGGTVYSFADPRPIAFIACSPQGPGDSSIPQDNGLRANSYDTMTRPTLFLTGAGDDSGGIVPETRRLPFDLGPGGDWYRGWITEEEANHGTFNYQTDSCIADGGLRCLEYLDWLGSAALAFLDAHVREDAFARAYLGSENLDALSGSALEWSRR